MSGAVTVYSIQPLLGCGLNQTYPTSKATVPSGITQLTFPDPATEFGMNVGKVVRGSDAFHYILVNSGSGTIAAGGTVTVGPPDFTQGGTGTGISGKNTLPNSAVVPAYTLFWAQTA